MGENDFLHRTRALLGEESLDILQNSLVAIAGLGGVGGAAFLNLVRGGIRNFRLAENGTFDPPDMNRQWGALGSTMGKKKIDVYAQWARQINPNVQLKLYPQGIQVDNIEEFLTGADVYLGVIDLEVGQEVKEKSNIICREKAIPIFTAGVIGFGALMVNQGLGGMSLNEFWQKAAQFSQEPGALPSYLTSNFSSTLTASVEKGLKSGTIPTSSVGGSQAGTLLASETLAYLLKEKILPEREIIFAPRFVCLDPLSMRLTIGDINKN